MIDAILIKAIDKAAQLISIARYVVAFTGAGISTSSGIPDFRSQGTGLWQRDDPVKVASATAFNEHPEVFFNWLRPLLQSTHHALPNPAHVSLAEMEREGIVKSVITQNIDGLHQLSGSRKVIELHGTLKVLICTKCHHKITSEDESYTNLLSGGIPYCEVCRQILKPGITLFEENLPLKAWQNAEAEMRRADLVIVAGSSLEVVPAATLPYNAVKNGARLIIINLSSTYLDGVAEVKIPWDVSVALPAIRTTLARAIN